MMKYRAPQLYGMQATKAVCSNGTGAGIPETWEHKCGNGATEVNDCNVGGIATAGVQVSPASACQTTGGSDGNWTSCCGNGSGNTGYEYKICDDGCGAL